LYFILAMDLPIIKTPIVFIVNVYILFSRFVVITSISVNGIEVYFVVIIIIIIIITDFLVFVFCLFVCFSLLVLTL
jgi:hypothetical protein